MSEYKPCPFCGRTDGFQVKTVWKTYRFVACKCKAAGPVMKNDVEAIEAWNTRKMPEQLKRHIEEVDYLCDMCANGCDERRTIRVGQSARDVCEKWQEVDA